MNNLSDLFLDIQKNKREYLKAKTGNDFNNRILEKLYNLGFTRIQSNDAFAYANTIKNKVLEKISTSKIENKSNYRKCFISQPYGSNNFPDILVFDDDRVIPIEIKYSEKSASKPVWNSNIPKHNSFYIFGSYSYKKNGDITFFCGEEVISLELTKILVDFFEKIQTEEKNFEKLLVEKIEKEKNFNTFGWNVYIRSAFEQTKFSKLKKGLSIDINFFSNANRKEIEQRTIVAIKKYEITKK